MAWMNFKDDINLSLFLFRCGEVCEGEYIFVCYIMKWMKQEIAVSCFFRMAGRVLRRMRKRAVAVCVQV